jgi:gamma-glutamyltranspeptidase/glutathione hydrolase
LAQSVYGLRGIAVAPHSLAAESAISVMREGGNAIEAMIASAATIAVVYPHMNSIGGDAFWVINGPNNRPGGIDASGLSARAASRDWYASQGITQSIPFRGGVAALTVAGTISGWGAAHALSKNYLGGKLPLSRLLADAIYLAKTGIPVTESQALCTETKMAELKDQIGFASSFLPDGGAPLKGSLFKQQRLADTLSLIASEGTETFYRGSLAKNLAHELAKAGSPLRLRDLNTHQAKLVDPLTVPFTNKSGQSRLFNMVPPSQGLISLMILGIMDRIDGWDHDPEGPEFIHTQVEATKLAFGIRDHCLTDPAFMSLAPQDLLSAANLNQLASKLDTNKAAAWGQKTSPGDTVWLGAIDQNGISVSFIQSIYHEFGSGVVLPSSGVNWQNRGCSFSLNPEHINTLEPEKKPFHTLNPAMAQQSDGGLMVYGTMGGDGQPQTQATIFNRTMRCGDHPQQAIERPRWLLGRTWGQSSDSLKLESRFPLSTIKALQDLGHDVQTIGAWDEAVGHAGMLIRHPNGVLEGGFDPRSNGAVASY